MLKPPADGGHAKTRGFFGWFNRTFDRARTGYGNGVAKLVRHVRPAALLYVGLVALTGYLFGLMPAGFMPDEDQRTIFVQVQLPPGATDEMTEKANNDVREYFQTREKDNVDS